MDRDGPNHPPPADKYSGLLLGVHKMFTAGARCHQIVIQRYWSLLVAVANNLYSCIFTTIYLLYIYINVKYIYIYILTVSTCTVGKSLVLTAHN